MKHDIERLARIETVARRMANSGAYVGYRSVLSALQQQGYTDASRIFRNPWTQSEIDRLCALAYRPVNKAA